MRKTGWLTPAVRLSENVKIPPPSCPAADESVARTLLERKSRSKIFSASWTHRPPVRSRLSPGLVARTKQHLQLMRRQLLRGYAGIGAGWPPAETPLGKPLVARPKTLAVVDQRLHRRAAPIAEHEHVAAEGVLLQRLPADPGQTVHPAAEIRGLDRHRDPHLRRELDHRWPSQKLWLSATKSGTATPLRCTYIIAPAWA